MKISACMITKNEEKCIERCINSYKNITDEIIVVDTGSSDDTVKIAKELGATVFQIEWINDFSYAKNYAIDRATGDWIIFLDADEYFEPIFDENAKKLLEKIWNEGIADVVACDIVNFENEQGAIATIDNIQRIFRNDRGIKYKDKIHEHIFKPNDMLKILHVTEFSIMHTGYTNEVLKEKYKRNLKVLLAEENGKNDFRRLGYLAESYFETKDYKNAYKYADQLMQTARFSQEVKKDTRLFRVYGHKIMSMIYQKNFEKIDIEKVLTEALSLFPRHPEILHVGAIFYDNVGETKKSIEYYEKAFENQASEKKYENAFMQRYDEKCVHIAKLYEKISNKEKAKEYYVKGIKRNKNNLVALEGFLRNAEIYEITELVTENYDENEFADMQAVVAVCLITKNKMATIKYVGDYIKKWPQAVANDNQFLEKVQEVLGAV